MIKNKEQFRLMLSGSFLTGMGVAGGLLGYFYQLLMGRMLGPSDYAALSATVSLYLIFSSPLLALNLIIARRIAALIATKNIKKVSDLFRRSFKLISVVSVSAIFLSVTLLGYLTQYFTTETLISLMTILILLALAAFAHLSNAYFQGREYFGYLGGNGVAQIALKILFSCALVGIGLKVSGAYLGFILSVAVVQLLMFIHIFRQISLADEKYIFCESENVSKSPSHLLHISLGNAMPVVAAAVAITIFSQFDIIIAKWTYSSQTAGIYSAASILAKTILYLPGGFVLAMYPMIAKKLTLGEDDSNMVILTLSLVLLPCLVASSLFYMYSYTIVDMFYGAEYAEAAPILRWLGFALIPLACIIVLEHFLIAKGRVIYAYVFLAFAPIQFFVAYNFSEDVNNLVLIIFFSGVLMLLFGAFFMRR